MPRGLGSPPPAVDDWCGELAQQKTQAGSSSTLNLTEELLASVTAGCQSTTVLQYRARTLSAEEASEARRVHMTRWLAWCR